MNFEEQKVQLPNGTWEMKNVRPLPMNKTKEEKKEQSGS